MSTITAQSHPNIAFIKYWGNCEPEARIPANGSISMNLDGLHSRLEVTFDPSLEGDELVLNGQLTSGDALQRVSDHLDRVRRLAGINTFAHVDGSNNFPMGTGIASSASAFAALSLAASKAAGLDLDQRALSQLARQGSGSACRSVPGGYVEWLVSGCEVDSYAVSIAPPEHWQLVDCVAIVSREHKATGSTEGHSLAYTSPLQVGRVDDAPRRLDICRSAILQRDFDALAEIMELDSNMMHAVMMTSTPRLIYWAAATLSIMGEVVSWRNSGVPACYTIDAGPNVHVITLAEQAEGVVERLKAIPGVLDVLTAPPGGPAAYE